MHGVSKLPIKQSTDGRGDFKKIVQVNQIPEYLEFEIREVFVSRSVRGVIRGMHLMVGSSASFRTINVSRGKVLDVLLDLRDGSPTYGKTLVYELSSLDDYGMLIPPGVAHGFHALEESEMIYTSSKSWDPSLDTGVNPLSLDFNWPIAEHKISDRDEKLPSLAVWQSQREYPTQHE